MNVSKKTAELLGQAGLLLAIAGVDVSRLLGSYRTPKYRTKIEYEELATKLYNAEITVKRLRNPRTKRQQRELKAAQDLLDAHAVAPIDEDMPNPSC